MCVVPMWKNDVRLVSFLSVRSFNASNEQRILANQKASRIQKCKVRPGARALGARLVSVRSEVPACGRLCSSGVFFLGMTDNVYFIIGALAVAISLLFVTSLIGVWCSCSRVTIRSASRGRATAKETIKRAETLTKDQASREVLIMYVQMAAIDHATAFNANDVKNIATKVNALSEAAVATFLEEMRYKRPQAPVDDPAAKRVLDGGLATCKSGRDPHLEINESSQAPIAGQHIKEKDRKALHVNIVDDLYGHEILISAAPPKDSFAGQWELLWQRRVGVIVWLGTVGTKKKDSIDPYIGTGEGSRQVHGRFEVTTIEAVRYLGMYRIYTITLQNTSIYTTVDFRGREKREISFVHVDYWPEKWEKTNAEKLSTVIEMVRAMSLLQFEKNMPSIMVNCATGLEASCAFTAAYLGRQMQLRFNVLNVKTVLKMIERLRYKAFASQTAIGQIRLVYGILVAMVDAYPRPNGGIESPVKVETFENHLCRSVIPTSTILRASSKSNSKSNSLRTALSTGISYRQSGSGETLSPTSVTAQSKPSN